MSRSSADVAAPLRVRANFVSQALRPADSTDRWIAWRAGSDRAQLDAAMAGVSLIEAADEREEALAIAIAMREALETAGRDGGAGDAGPRAGAARRRRIAALGRQRR